MNAIIANSDAVGLLPLTAVMAEVQSGSLCVHPFVEPWFESDFAVARLAQGGLSRVGETFVRMVQEANVKTLELERRVAPELLVPPRRTRIKTRKPRRVPRWINKIFERRLTGDNLGSAAGNH